MAKIEDDILKYLERAAARDAEKGGEGWRSTSDVVDHLGRDRGVVYRRLDKMFQAAAIEAAAPIDIGGTLWRARQALARAEEREGRDG